MEPLERHAAAVERVKRWFALRGRTVSDDAVLRQALALYERLLAGVDAVAKSSPRIAVDVRGFRNDTLVIKILLEIVSFL